MTRLIHNVDVLHAPAAPRAYWFVSTPYSAYPSNLETAHDAACRFAARLIDNGWPIFCPIAHTHVIAKYMTHDPRDSAFWMEVNRGPMEAAAGLIVAQMPGWESSVGIAGEVEYFVCAERTVLYLDPTAPVPVYETAVLRYALQQMKIAHQSREK